MNFVAIPIGHAGTTLHETHRHFAQALSATRTEIEQHRAIRRGAIDPATDSGARTHDSFLFKSLMPALTKLAQQRLTGIIRNRQSLVHGSTHMQGK